ncbi:hypothetical protein AJ78_05121 [Emergomyces pasteurianus Ep9510]|uniref:Uncharacterized protein n=1 Tax=Emergomyces pasteurianus Ep9510 TaxID=1447872 RepID=A0A1J9QF25_9EURO|nr:hypothetical protein AJ78_05121 [Emergomyces pasteurianus Ep9510]
MVDKGVQAPSDPSEADTDTPNNAHPAVFLLLKLPGNSEAYMFGRESPLKTDVAFADPSDTKKGLCSNQVVFAQNNFSAGSEFYIQPTPVLGRHSLQLELAESKPFQTESFEPHLNVKCTDIFTEQNFLITRAEQPLQDIVSWKKTV